MFERAKINSSVSYLLRASKGSNTLKYSALEKFLSSRSAPVAKIMKEQKLTADQAAVLLISSTFAEFDEGTWCDLQTEMPELASDFGRLILGCEALFKSQPATFAGLFMRPNFDVGKYFS